MDRTSIAVAIITGGLALLGTWLTVRSGNQKIQADLTAHEKVQDERIKVLTEEVRKHNGFAERIPAIEAEYRLLKELFCRCMSDRKEK